MTTPTPEQIEAALNAYGNAMNSPQSVGYAEAMKAALTAAADVGEHKSKNVQIREDAQRRCNTLDTIERCAQVAENMPHGEWFNIAAAIRALKQETDK